MEDTGAGSAPITACATLTPTSGAVSPPEIHSDREFHIVARVGEWSVGGAADLFAKPTGAGSAEGLGVQRGGSTAEHSQGRGAQCRAEFESLWGSMQEGVGSAKFELFKDTAGGSVHVKAVNGARDGYSELYLEGVGVKRD